MPVPLVGFGDRREAQHFRLLQAEDVADEVVLIRAMSSTACLRVPGNSGQLFPISAARGFSNSRTMLH
jgi:hypothetical protein